MNFDSFKFKLPLLHQLRLTSSWLRVSCACLDVDAAVRASFRMFIRPPSTESTAALARCQNVTAQNNARCFASLTSKSSRF